MFGHVELVIPPTLDVVDDVNVVMRRVRSRPKPWCDFHYIGGAWNGLKLLADLDLVPFERKLDEMRITVSAVRWNGSRESMHPESQAEAVDAEWRRLYPGHGDSCPLFAQYKGPPDINWCTVRELPEDLNATRLVVAKPRAKQRFIHMLSEEGLRHFGNKVKPAIRSLQKITPESPTDDWLVVTLCCHW
jgi:hypothetical protein